MDLEMNGKQAPDDPPPAAVTSSQQPETAAAAGKLLHVSQEAVDHKDFSTEVRGLRDVSSLLDKCSVLLDVQVGMIYSHMIFTFHNCIFFIWQSYKVTKVGMILQRMGKNYNEG